MKKLLITILTFTAAFILGANLTLYASSDWLLSDDGYYYYQKDIKYDGTIHELESHNGTGLEVYNPITESISRMSYKARVKAVYHESVVEGWDQINDVGDFLWTNDDPVLVAKNNYIEKYDRILRKGNVSLGDYLEQEIRYPSEVYNSSSPGNLDLGTYSNPTFIKITEEEFNQASSINQIHIPIYDSYAEHSIHDAKYVNWKIKRYPLYRDLYNDFTDPSFVLENHVFKIMKQDFNTGDQFNPNYHEIAYYKVIIDGSEIINLSNYNELPTTYGNMNNGLDGVATVFISKISGNYQIQVNYDSKIYRLLVDNVPQVIASSKKVHYFTDKGQRYFVGFYETDNGWIDNELVAEDVLNNSWILWNPITGSFTSTENNTVHVKLSARGDGFKNYNQLYAEVVIPHEIDDLLAIAVKYTYQHKYLFGNVGNKITVHEQILLKGQAASQAQPWWNMFYGSAALYGLIHWTNKDISEIREITPDNKYKLDYVDWLEEHGSGTYSVQEIFTPQSKVYDLYLGAKDKFGSVGVFTTKFAVLSYRYEVKGVEYSNPFVITEAPPMPEPPSPFDPLIEGTKSLFEKIWAFIVKFSYIAIPIVGLITSPFIIKVSAAIFGKKVYKKRVVVVLAWIGLLLAAWYLLLN